jgi:predicted ATPase
VGRQEELVSVAKALEASRLVTLTGAGGVGKTRLALQGAANLVTDFSAGAWLCELAAAVDRESMLQVFAAALGYAPAPGADLEQGISKFVGSQRMFLVLDNCEHLLDPVAALAETLLERCPNLAILVTSREALEVGGERVIRLRSLPVPQAGASLDQLADFDAARLFLDRADAAGTDVALEAADGPAIAEICRRLDGIPLAIELAAARVIAFGPGEIAARLDERFRLLTGGRRAAVERHHTLRATIDWSYTLLSQRDQTVFNHLGVFPASFDADAAQAVAGAGGVEPWDVLDALTSLVAKSMLNADRGAAGPTRYQMLESLRHYARERLDGAGGADVTRRCHARHYVGIVAEIGSGLRGPDELLWRRRLDADLDNFRAAVAWSLDSALQEDGEVAMVILGELIASMFGGMTDIFNLAGVNYERAAERARRVASPYASLGMTAAAMNGYTRGDFRLAGELSREAVRGARMSPYPGAVLQLKLMFVEPESLAVELNAAMQILDEAGADLADHAWVHGVAAVMAAIFGNLTLAQHEAVVALDLSRRIGNPTLLELSLYGTALASWQSEPNAAQAASQEYIRIARSTGAHYILGRVQALLAQLLARAGDLPAAIANLREGLENANIIGDQPGIAVCLARGAAVMAARGEHETAAVFVGAVTNGVLPRRSGVSPNEIPDYDEFVTTLRSQLGDDRHTAAINRGAAMTYEQASAFALAAIEGLRRS